MLEIFSSGGGTQSSAIMALIVQGKLPRPDYILIADTGRECSETWQYLTRVIEPECRKMDIELFRVTHDWFNMPAHGKDYINHKGNTLLLGAWTNINGQIGKLSNFCSKTWKQQPRDRFLSRQLNIKPSQGRKWIGFSTDEWKRAQRIMVSKEGQAGLIRLPLIQDIPLSRQQCLSVVKEIGWPDPPRSRCWICPNQGDEEWRDLSKRFPKDFQKAIEFERELHQFDSFAYLHKSCVPLDRVEFTEEPTLFDPSLYCSSGVCFV